MKQITLRVPDDMAQMIEEWAERIPEMEVVKTRSSLYQDEDDIEQRLAAAINTLLTKKIIRHIYDYTWIMIAISEGVIEGLGGFRSPQSFMDYLHGLGIESVPSRTTLSTWLGKVDGMYPDWVFTDTEDPQEVFRRKNVVMQLLSLLEDTD